MKEISDLTYNTMKWLAEKYLANAASEHSGEYVSCITPPSGSGYHLAWRAIYKATHPDYEPKEEVK